MKDVQLRPNEPPVLDDNDKAVRFDVSCTFDDGEAADVEMQGADGGHSFGVRAEYLCARLLNSVVRKGEDWRNILKVYQISLLNFIFDKNDQSAVSRYRMRKDNGYLLSGIQTVIFLELPKIDALGAVPPEDLNSEQKWCKFFLDADNPDRQEYVGKLAAEEGGIMEAQKTLDKISSDWVLWKRELDREVIESDRKTELRYMQEEGLEKGLKQGIQQGIEQGIQQGISQGIEQGIEQGISQGTMQAKKDTACNLKKLGVPVQTIVQATGLSETEIAGL